MVYVPDTIGDGAFVVTAFELSVKANAIPSPPTEKEEMTKKQRKNTYPAGWDKARTRKLAEHYDNQTEDEQVAEHEAAFLAEGQTVMVVPSELVPEIVRLIRAKRPA